MESVHINVVETAKIVHKTIFCDLHNQSDATSKCGPCRSLRRKDLKSHGICVVCERRMSIANMTKCHICKIRTNRTNVRHTKKKRTIKPEYFTSKSLEQRLKLRQLVLRAYGCTCVCCGEATDEFLTIDHVDGGGNKHRRAIGGGSYLYGWLKKHNFPSGFQILCVNCQLGKEKGICPPHKARSPLIEIKQCVF